MKFIVLLTIVINIFFLNNISYANENISPALISAYEKFATKVQKKYNTQQEIDYFKKLDRQLILILEKKNLGEKKQLILDLRKLNNEMIFELTLGISKQKELIKLSRYDASKLFTHKLTNEYNLVEEEGVWYTYNYTQYLSFPEGTIIDKKTLDYNKIDYANDIVFMKDNTITFIKQYKKVKLISDSIIYGIPDKLSFLEEVKDDKKTLFNDSDADFIKLKSEAEELSTKNSRADIIKKVYNHVIGEVQYTQVIDLQDSKIFSGIETHKNADGVCEGYTKLMKYLLNFSGISDVDVIRGYVIDAQDFPKIGHAWIEVDGKYYDPTFDDPLGLTKTRVYEDYKYYGLPKDLFYTNRYNFEELDENLKTKPLTEREQLVQTNIAQLSDKYSSDNYNLLKPFAYRISNGFDVNEVFTIDKIKKIFPYYEVTNFGFTDEQNKKKNISKLIYYTVSDSDIENILNQFNYDMKGFYLFKWNDGNSSEYRLAHNVEF